jgi:ABC-type branched-subunit amino acid transport system ATPase component
MPPELLVEPPPATAPARPLALSASLDVLRDGVPVVRGAELELHTGAALGLVGRNGAGKTSLLAGILGFLPTVGSLWAFDADMRRWPTHRRALHGLAIVPQGRRLFPDLTVADNLRAATVSPAAGGPEFDVLDLFPGLGELLDRQAGVLSGGQQQQVSIARALLRRPRLLLLDEPTEGLAPGLVEEVVGALAALRASGLTLVIAEQRLDVVTELCDTAAVMRAGEVAARGEPASTDVREQLLAL